MALIPRQLLFLDPPQRELPEEGLRHKGDKGDEGSWWKTGKQPLGPHPAPPSNTNVSAHSHTQKPLAHT